MHADVQRSVESGLRDVTREEASLRRTRRTRLKILADVLGAARNNSSVGSGITSIQRRANLSTVRLQRFLRELTTSGLLEVVTDGTHARYRTSASGLGFLMTFVQFEELIRSIGLRI